MEENAAAPVATVPRVRSRTGTENVRVAEESP